MIVQTYKAKGICATSINFELHNNTVKNVKFVGGCKGNTKAIENLVENMDIKEVINRLKGIPCRNNTSCPDQLAKALEENMQ